MSHLKKFLWDVIKGFFVFFFLYFLFIYFGAHHEGFLGLIIIVSGAIAIIGIALGLFKGIIRFIARSARND